MFGFVIGTLCLVALVKMHRYRRWAWAHAYGVVPDGGPHPHGWHRRWAPWEPWGRDGGPGGPMGPMGFAPRRGRAGLYALMRALDATPAQEKVILQAADELRDAGRELRGEWKDSRADLAAALRADSFDAERMGLTFARHDERLEALRKAFVGALAKVHDALDERQRARLAEWLDRGGGRAVFGGMGFGPYR